MLHEYLLSQIFTLILAKSAYIFSMWDFKDRNIQYTTTLSKSMSTATASLYRHSSNESPFLMKAQSPINFLI